MGEPQVDAGEWRRGAVPEAEEGLLRQKSREVT